MATYYNEHDPKAAAWLRELIKRGLIPDGEVDERGGVHPRLPRSTKLTPERKYETDQRRTRTPRPAPPDH